jgi:hypothetical protein
MKIKMTMHDGSVRAVTDVTATSALCEGACPHCIVEPFRVAGSGGHISADDRAYEADGGCIACGVAVGVLRAETGTLFGLREDEAIARLGIRIY